MNVKKISIFTKIKNFLPAIYNHIKTGMQKCNKKTILQRLSICQKCEHFIVKNDKHNHSSRTCKQIKGSCGICGCIISDKRVTFNKLAWKEQKCPDGRW